MARRVVKRKIKHGKIWFTLHAPKIFNENEIGKTLGKEEKEIIGRTISIPLSEVNKDITKRNINLKLRIIKVTGEHAYTSIVSYELSKPFLQRMIRRKSNKIEIVKNLKLKDGKKYRIKIIAVTLHKAKSSQLSGLNKEISKEIETVIPTFDIETLITALVTGKLQREIQKRVSKIYPLRYLDIGKISTLKEKKEVKKQMPAPKAE